MAMCNIFSPYKSLEEACSQFNIDINVMTTLLETHYINGQEHRVAKQGNMHLAWEYAANPQDHHCFLSMLRLSPTCFDILLSLIEDHPIFQNNSNVCQHPVEEQLAVTLYRLGCTLPSPTDSTWTPHGLHKSIWTPS